MSEIYVRVRQPNGTYERVGVGTDQSVYRGATRYYDCRKCGKHVAVTLQEDLRNGYCFHCMPRGMKLNGNNRVERIFDEGKA